MTSRRDVLAGLGAFSLTSAWLPRPAVARNRASIAIIGGGFGGASAAMTLRTVLPDAKITLIEPNPTYTACPFSNLVIAGLRSLDQQVFSYDGLRSQGIEVVATRATDVDPTQRVIETEAGTQISYDRLILSPGVDLIWDAIEGYDQSATQRMPHAWKAGSQTTLLRDQLRATEDGGVVVMSVPAAPYRCPPGPYERASLIAHYLKTEKPRSKLIILDAKDSFSKQALFEETWETLYPGMIDWRPGSFDGRVTRVDANAGTVFTDFETLTPAVSNIIPPQRAAEIAMRAGVTDSTGWCPINAQTFASTLQPNIYVIGDATIAAPMPKSAFAANAQGKICALQIARDLAGLPPAPSVLSNTCYSHAAPEAAFSISGVYGTDGGIFSSRAGGTSDLGASADMRAREALEAVDWYSAVTKEAFG
ncbi:MAG: NAD(P)/FAD-dependent oxidoreductase [Pseudomonadota bacterium]